MHIFYALKRMSKASDFPPFVVATRIHLGRQKTPPPQSKLNSTVKSFLGLASSIGAAKASIAVDSQPKIEGYDLVQAIEEAIVHASKNLTETEEVRVECDIVRVSPWGNFILPLNALIAWACTTKLPNDLTAKSILFVSAEMSLTSDSVRDLHQVMDSDTLVVGAVLPGHDYKGRQDERETVVELNGRTCPWNTAAMWNLEKVGLFGFPLVAEGILKDEEGKYVPGGIEEFSTILLQQKIFSPDQMKAKLMKVTGVEWEQKFEDAERRLWHETKMKSKFTRAEAHRELLGVEKGFVIHC